MATEGPMIRDGAHHTAYANYYNPASALKGPGGSGQFLAMVPQAAGVAQIQTVEGGVIYGILQNTPPSGVVCDIAIAGICKAVAGAALSTVFTPLMVSGSEGTLIPWTAGSGYNIVAYNLDTAAAQYDLVKVVLVGPGGLKVLT